MNEQQKTKHQSGASQDNKQYTPDSGNKGKVKEGKIPPLKLPNAVVDRNNK